jgi:hypothetical protein
MSDITSKYWLYFYSYINITRLLQIYPQIHLFAKQSIVCRAASLIFIFQFALGHSVFVTGIRKSWLRRLPEENAKLTQNVISNLEDTGCHTSGPGPLGR